MTPKMKALALGGFAASVLGGGIGGALAATAATASTITLAANSTSPTTGTGPAPPAMPPPGSAAHENAEVAVTGADAARAQAAAVKALGGGTAGAVTTDFTKNGYEVTVTRADGTRTEVHLDSSFNVLQHGPGRPHDNDADDSGTGSGGGA